MEGNFFGLTWDIGVKAHYAFKSLGLQPLRGVVAAYAGGAVGDGSAVRVEGMQVIGELG